jgi:1,4-dihydroxy-6-naphthoate synthase
MVPDTLSGAYTLASQGVVVTATSRKISVAFSPDADDAFMYYGIEQGVTDTRGLSLTTELGDIETLNQRARAGELDVTAVSFGAWPAMADRYDLLTVGSSFGLGYGPKLVTRPGEQRGPDEARRGLAGKRVGVPGENTTAALLLRLFLPEAETVAVPFDEVGQRVLAGELDAGVVIHEGQVTFEKEGLALVRDLGEWWSADTGGLPVPLGANVIRSEFPDDVVRDFKAVMSDSIAHARAHPAEALTSALRFGRGADEKDGALFVEMYVNDLTLDPGESGRRAVDELYARGAAAGLLPETRARWR